MAFVVGEVDLGIGTQRRLLAPPVQGKRYVLLDPVRDETFLNKSSTDGLGNNISDMGLGLVDNGLFVYTTKFTPGSPTVPRPYPVKFFWIGSPAGTTDANDTFSIFMADVNQSAFYPGAPGSVWLVNPRLVLSYQQAKNDIVAWFDANYPGGGTNGVGNGNSGSNTAYGTLAGGSSAVGNVSGMSSIDGQFWPIYDYVDNSILLYFSIKTPNQNTLSLYCYKITDTEVSTPATTANFLGGVYGGNWGVTVHTVTWPTIFSSHRFSIMSPDPLRTVPPVSGKQPAVFAYSNGTFDGSTPDHGIMLRFAVVSDIHGSPLTGGGAYANSEAEFMNLDFSGLFPPDKIGQLFVCPPVGNVQAGYGVLYTSPSTRDIRSGSNNVVLSAMQVRIAYWNPVSYSQAIGDTPILTSPDSSVQGLCRASFTAVPDGLTKIVYAGFTFDQALGIYYSYVDIDALSPAKQKKLYLPNVIFNGSVIYSYGKKKLVLSNQANYFATTSAGANPNATVNKLYFQMAGGWTVDQGRLSDSVFTRVVHLPPTTYRNGPQYLAGNNTYTTGYTGYGTNLPHVVLHDIPPFLVPLPLGATPTGAGISNLNDYDVYLED